MTGTTTDAVTGMPHLPPNTAGRFKTPQDYVTAAREILFSQKYYNILQKTIKKGESSFGVSIDLEKIFGPNYQSLVEGVSLNVKKTHHRDTERQTMTMEWHMPISSATATDHILWKQCTQFQDNANHTSKQ